MNLWDKTPGLSEEIPQITYYPAKNKTSNGAVVVFAGGGYSHRADHEGKGYADLFNSFGIDSFVVDYRVAPHRHPLPLLDARRGVRWVRYYADKYGIDPNKIAVIGSSAGGHLVSTLCTYKNKIEFEGIDEIDNLDYLPNAQILCYPVIALEGYGHIGSGENLLGDKYEQLSKEINAIKNIDENAPQAFIWHTNDDSGVNVKNSLEYAIALKENNVDVELHVFPHGHHGLGVAADNPHVAQWTGLVEKWIRTIGF